MSITQTGRSITFLRRGDRDDVVWILFEDKAGRLYEEFEPARRVRGPRTKVTSETIAATVQAHADALAPRVWAREQCCRAAYGQSLTLQPVQEKQAVQVKVTAFGPEGISYEFVWQGKTHCRQSQFAFYNTGLRAHSTLHLRWVCEVGLTPYGRDQLAQLISGDISSVAYDQASVAVREAVANYVAGLPTADQLPAGPWMQVEDSAAAIKARFANAEGLDIHDVT